VGQGRLRFPEKLRTHIIKNSTVTDEFVGMDVNER